jgi:hypothetical protein
MITDPRRDSHTIFAVSGPTFPVSTSFAVNEDGMINFPAVDLENMSVADTRFLLQEYLGQCWSK